MIQVLSKRNLAKKIEIEPAQDVIVKKYETEITYNEKGQKIETRKERRVNVTKLVNESAKMLKVETAQDVIKKLENMLTK